MFKLKEVIEDEDRKYLNSLKKYINYTPYGIVLTKEFDSNKDELSQLEMNEINSELKQRWLK